MQHRGVRGVNMCGFKEKQLERETNREQNMRCILCLILQRFTVLQTLDFPEIQQTEISRDVLVP
mgnify:CR=1 FL=1